VNPVGGVTTFQNVSNTKSPDFVHPALNWEMTSQDKTTTHIGSKSLGAWHHAATMRSTEALSGQSSVFGMMEALVWRRGGRQYAGSPAC
jgi:hypothetical protein